MRQFKSWQMHADIPAAKGAFDVLYKDRAGIGRRQRFGTREQAEKLAEVTGGHVVPVVPRQFRLAPITGK